MDKRSVTESLVSIVEEPQIRQDAYSNEGPLIHHPTGDVAFGGCIVGQAVSAALATVPTEFKFIALQSSFLRPIRASKKVIYHVERTTDGRRFATRVVTVTQSTDDHAPCLYTAIVSFQKPSSSDAEEKVRDYHSPMPEVGDTIPHRVPQRGFRQFGFGQSAEDDEKNDPVEWRPISLLSPSDPLQIRAHGFVRVPPLSTSSYAVHIATMAYMSDESLLGLVLLTDPKAASKDIRSLAMTTTLTHQISFHSFSIRADEWMVCESSRSWAASGRIFLLQRFWSLSSGRLLMSSTQEAIITRPKASL
ncbi:thioesterase-like superfamily-domain-containing protein [Nemania abortiva]|nr:thioesterase-like superfamily-domain-containing protein [Nemania abortiva]